MHERRYDNVRSKHLDTAVNKGFAKKKLAGLTGIVRFEGDDHITRGRK